MTLPGSLWQVDWKDDNDLPKAVEEKLDQIDSLTHWEMFNDIPTPDYLRTSAAAFPAKPLNEIDVA